MRRGARLVALALAVALPGCRTADQPAQPTGEEIFPVAIEAEFTDLLADLLSAPAGSRIDDVDPDDDFAHAPPQSPHAAGLAAGWTEPVRVSNDGTATWSWEGAGSSWELVVRGTPSLFVNGWELRERTVDGVKKLIKDKNLG